MLTKTSSGTRILMITKKQIPSILTHFERFCKIDLQHGEGTAYRRLLDIRRFLSWANGKEISRDVIRSYLEKYSSKSPHTYKRVLCSLRIFFNDYLQREDLIKTFRFPEIDEKPIIVPSREQLQKFYRALRYPHYKAMFLMYATTGLRESELLSLKLTDVDLERRMVIPNKYSRTKRTWVAFFNEEAKDALVRYLSERTDDDERLFPIKRRSVIKMFKKAGNASNVQIMVKTLRAWFCCQMGELGVPDRYIDAFCGRVPKSILARHYTDYSPERLKRIYDKAGLKVLS